MPNNFLANYFTYCEGSETPELYDIWSSLVALSSIVSRRVWLDLGYFRIYANLYVVLVGAPGGRKTSSMSICKELLEDIGNISFSATCQTKESLCKYMSSDCIKMFEYDAKLVDATGATVEKHIKKQYTPVTLCLTELSHFLGSGTSAHMIDFLTTIYDAEHYDAKTKGRGEDIIPGPYLTILACTTPSNITRYLKEDVISGGFSRRTLFAFELDDGEPIPFPEITPTGAKAWLACIEWGKKLQTVVGEFTWTPEAKTWYAEWYTVLFKSVKEKAGLMTYGYFRSKHIQLLKVAMLVALSETTELVLRIDHLLIASSMLDKLEKNMNKVFEGMGRNELSAVSARIIEFCSMLNKPVPEKEIMSAFFKDAETKELYTIINHLVSTEKLVQFNETLATGVKRRVLTTPEIADRLHPTWREAATKPQESSGQGTAPKAGPAEKPDAP